jgi:DNA polymerase-1
MKHLIIDGMNFAWRSKVWGPARDAPGFIFFRNLKALVELHSPDQVWYVLEGYPQARHDLAPAYKANRILASGDPKLQERKDFMTEIRAAVDVMAAHLPISTVRHPRWECDDTIYNLVKKALQYESEVIVSSSDSDFIQLIQDFPTVKLWNHTKKVYVESPDYDYVTWKALRGDGSDNIKGVKGVGDKTAQKLMADQDSLIDFLTEDSNRAQFERNVSLIRFHEFSEEERTQIEHTRGSFNPDYLRNYFESCGYPSMLSETYWPKFVATFERLK